MTPRPRWALAVAGVAVTLAALTPASAQRTARNTAPRIERQLAGIRIGTKAQTLLRMMPSPQVQLGAGMSGGGGDAAFGGGFGSPFGGGAPAMPGMMPGMGAPTSGMPGGPPMMPGGPPMPGGMALPPVGGPSMPGSNPFGAPGAEMGLAGDTTGTVAPTVTYSYTNARGIKGLSLDVQIDEDGRVIQIIGTSLGRPAVRTSRGIGFGDSYAKVVNAYGWPESHTSAGTFIQASYQDTAHVAFQFLNNRVVRIVVAEVS